MIWIVSWDCDSTRETGIECVFATEEKAQAWVASHPREDDWVKWIIEGYEVY